MGRTWKDGKGANSRKPNKKERRELEKLQQGDKPRYTGQDKNGNLFRSSYRSLKIEE